jgi:hypothetical protein
VRRLERIDASARGPALFFALTTAPADAIVVAPAKRGANTQAGTA